ncbi:hypothetical protein C1H46_041587 [Malus baccata]|uniref:Uncharacterized protein n=1 Tax=Malus baccata TaxID=106549 RepID=A0A540KFB1_MALBA|nr:hypothetical protein C1H46_041587 [Malus baccata]
MKAHPLGAAIQLLMDNLKPGLSVGVKASPTQVRVTIFVSWIRQKTTRNHAATKESWSRTTAYG